MKLSRTTLQLLRLAARDADDAGWSKVSSVVWPLVEKLPDELVLRARSDEGGGSIYVTAEGKVALRYSAGDAEQDR